MARIPKYEGQVDFRPAMQPFSSGDGYEAQGRGLQRVGQGIASLGQGIASLQGAVDQNDEFNAKLTMLKLSNEQDLDDMQSRQTFNPDQDDPDGYAPGRMMRFQERADAALGTIKTDRARRNAMLHIERMRGVVGERATQFGGQQKQQLLFRNTETAITSEFDKLMGFQPVQPSADAENQAGYMAAGSAPATPDMGEQYMSRFEQTLRSAEAIIQSMPTTPQAKQQLSKHAASLAMAALGRKQDAWPAVEQWLTRQREGMGGEAPGASAALGQAPSGASIGGMKGGSPMSVAKSYLGANETRDTKVLAEFFEKAGGQKLDPAKTAWCAAFVNAALGASGQQGTGTLLARDFLKVGTATDRPAEGDIVVLTRGDPRGWQGHVGFYAGRDSNGNVLVLGGNQGNKVSVQSYPASRVLGYRKPPEAGTQIAGMNLPQRVAQGMSGTATDASMTAQSPIRATLTAYAPQAGASNTSSEQGNYLAARPGPDGQNVVRTLDDFASGRAPYVTVAGNPNLNGRRYTIPRIEYQDASGNVKVLENVPAVVHDTGGAFRNAPEGRFDIPVARDVDARVRNANHARWKKAGVEFMPDAGGGPQVTPLRPVMSGIRSELTEALQKAAPAMKEGYRKQIDGMVSQVEEMAAKGQQAPDTLVADLQSRAARSGDAALMQRVQLLPQVLAASRAENQASPAELTQVIQQIEAQAQRGPVTPQMSAQLDHLKKKRAETEKAISKDPYEHGTRVGILPAPVPEIRPGLPPAELQASLEARSAARTAIEMKMGQPVPLLQGGEQQALIEYLNDPNTPPEVRLGTMRVMYDVLGPGMLKDAREIFAKDAPHLAQLGWLMSNNADVTAMKDVVRGYDMRKREGFVSRVPESKDEIRTATDRVVGAGNSAFAALPGADGYAVEIAKLIYEARAFDKGLDPKAKLLDQTLWEESLNEAMGRNKVGETNYGGMSRVSTGLLSSAPVFVIPSIRAEGGLQEIMGKLQASDLVPSPAKAAAAAAGRDEMSPMQIPPGDARGRPVPIAVVRNATPVWAGGSTYFLRTGTDARGQPEFLKMTGAPDINYRLDIEALRDRMTPRVSKGTYRPLDGKVDTISDMLARYRSAPPAQAEPNMPDGSSFTPRFAPGSRKKQPAG